MIVKKTAAWLLCFMLLCAGAVADPVSEPTASQESVQEPTQDPSQEPSQDPSQVPSQDPSQEPSQDPSQVPSQVPTQEPSQVPTQESSQVPTQEPSQVPSQEPSQVPSQEPSQVPSQEPSQAPSQEPSQAPTQAPSQAPTQSASAAPETPSPVNYPYAEYMDAVITDVSRSEQGGSVIICLPISIVTENGPIFSSAAGFQSDWQPGTAITPAHFNQFNANILNLLGCVQWTLTAADISIDALFSDIPRSASLIARVPKDNPWQLPADMLYNTGYAVFNGMLRPDAPAGTHTLTFRLETVSPLTNSQPIEFRFEFTVKPSSAAPTSTAGITPEPSSDPTNAPTDIPTDTPFMEGTAEIGSMNIPTYTVGQTNAMLSVPVLFSTDGLFLYSNRDDNGGLLGIDDDGFSQAICDYVSHLEIELSDENTADNFPFELDGPLSETVIDDGTNYGYAVFSDLTVRSDLSNGAVEVPLTVRYEDIYGSTQDLDLSATVNITGSSAGQRISYSGGGGGYSSAAATAAPQARVIVESIASDPVNVQAGDTFDLIFSLRNTSTQQYVQNMRATITAEEDALLPVSGSNTLYIDRIDADTVYTLRYPVKARLDIPDGPLKVNISLEYEDRAVSAQSVSQELILNVAQKMRLNIGEPILDNLSPYANDDCTASLQVINEGRTLLYNVAVTATCSRDTLILPAVGYLGNMEGGTSKKTDLSFTPLQAGDYSVTLNVTWENALGEKYEEARTFSFTAQEEEIDYWNTPAGTYYNEPEDDADGDDDEIDAAYVLENLPLWIYIILAGLYLTMVIGIGISVRSRRRKVFEDDEME